MQGCKRTIVPCVHSLEHVDTFLAANLAYNNAIGPLAQSVLYEVANRYLTHTLDRGIARFHAHDMRVGIEPKFCGILDCYNAL